VSIFRLKYNSVIFLNPDLIQALMKRVIFPINKRTEKEPQPKSPKAEREEACSFKIWQTSWKYAIRTCYGAHVEQDFLFTCNLSQFVI